MVVFLIMLKYTDIYPYKNDKKNTDFSVFWFQSDYIRVFNLNNGVTDKLNNGATDKLNNGATDKLNNGATGKLNNGVTDKLNNGATAK